MQPLIMYVPSFVLHILDYSNKEAIKRISPKGFYILTQPIRQHKHAKKTKKRICNIIAKCWGRKHILNCRRYGSNKSDWKRQLRRQLCKFVKNRREYGWFYTQQQCSRMDEGNEEGRTGRYGVRGTE